MSDVIVWTKPACQQCRMVKFRLTAAGVEFVERDLTAPENAKDLEYFKGLGYSSAPITEYSGTIAAGFMPSEIDRVIAAWREHHPAEAQVVSGAMEAHHQTVCPECNSMIKVGERIVPDDFDEWGGTWQHETCPPAKFDIVREVCSICFTEKSVDGSCMCGAI